MKWEAIAEEFAGWALPGEGTPGLRPYQVRAGVSLCEILARQPGLTAMLVMPRQSGKDELLAYLETFLLLRLRDEYGSTVAATPTYKPQALIAMRRLKRIAEAHDLKLDTKENTYTLGRAETVFLSTDPDANVRGNTASVLLIGNEAQEIAAARWGAVFGPMTASTNAGTILAGTPWAQRGMLLAQKMAACEREGRLVRVGWREVAAELPAYGAKVEAEIAELGPQHPFILSEYECVLQDQPGTRRGRFSMRRYTWARHPDYEKKGG